MGKTGIALLLAAAILAGCGSSTKSSERVMSTQKFPTALMSVRATPRMTAIAPAIPAAAETKLCHASPAIWLK